MRVPRRCWRGRLRARATVRIAENSFRIGSVTLQGESWTLHGKLGRRCGGDWYLKPRELRVQGWDLEHQCRIHVIHSCVCHTADLFSLHKVASRRFTV
jgi:hypothetical protein